ncbi:efflux RND transporter periplasmic adaptor subunit [Xanthomonas fragariae]|uniref:Nickel and cobalt resistance protein CnrB n=2 Tax=Xanthomonas fragariae TaxID=48664 RepID=A0A1Y6HED9_9XANT|nr:HlyD family efflux transporter periplasmic adaptor subunit [Xanthomonas fragariae]AOD13707.1 hypothetical protein BER92_01890 [Xanthomonas fragariae]AOD17097.1 hypothetical protein BER93_01880 [Xanthomonas fragariae]ENZ95155.1 rnd efflux pump, membrane fusion protein, czcb subfamily [Xanthomonas fragariae LMG 25863]MBL9197431.1 efflux RND transporter periplasmic adaptor subunit [Xanthomonas fragariae]MBL9222568.1 efflux RND transporter periplasmic adaptor subunit [Xanthomonas fragariae]
MTMNPTDTTASEHAAAGASKGGQRRFALPVAFFLLASGVIAAGWWWSARAQPEAEDLPIAELSVTAVAPRQVEWPGTLSATGIVAPWQEAVIGSQSNGLRLLTLNVAVGDAVKRGQLLAHFDNATLLAARDANCLQLQQADITAPDDGLISAQSATLGAVANSGQELFRLVRQGRLEWRGEFTPEQIARIAVGQQVSLRLPDGSAAVARVRQIAPLLDARSRLGVVYADLQPGSLLRGGMYVDGAVALPATRALVVPASSVVVRDGCSTVFRIVGSGAQSKVRAQQVAVWAARQYRGRTPATVD